MNFWRDRNVFVTGVTGFLGGWLVDDLLARGARVTALVRDIIPHGHFYADGLAGRVNIVRGAVEEDGVVARAINEYEIETVFHLAAQAIVGAANRDPVPTFEANIRGTWVLLDACRKNPLVKRIVVASSDKAYGNHDVLPYDESFALQGSHPYDVSKSCADLLCTTYAKTYRTPVCITRCGNLFGPGDLNFNRIVPGTIRSALLGERPIIRSDGSPLRDYVYVKDIVQAYLLLAEKMDDPKLAGLAFNFGTGAPMSVLEITRAILAAADRPDLEPVVLNEAKGEILHQYLSSERARTRLGWKPGPPIPERLRETVPWYRRHVQATGGTRT